MRYELNIEAEPFNYTEFENDVSDNKQGGFRWLEKSPQLSSECSGSRYEQLRPELDGSGYELRLFDDPEHEEDLFLGSAVRGATGAISRAARSVSTGRD